MTSTGLRSAAVHDIEEVAGPAALPPGARGGGAELPGDEREEEEEGEEEEEEEGEEEEEAGAGPCPRRGGRKRPRDADGAVCGGVREEDGRTAASAVSRRAGCGTSRCEPAEAKKEEEEEEEEARLAEFLALSDDDDGDDVPDAAAAESDRRLSVLQGGACVPADVWVHLLPADSGGEPPCEGPAGNRRLPSPPPPPPHPSRSSPPLPSAQPERPIPGLLLFRGLLPRRHQRRLMTGLRDTGHFAGPGPLSDQGVRFGPAPPELEWLDRWLERALAPHLAGLGRRRLAPPFFDHAIANLYRPGQGIRDHVDLARFADGVVGVSLVGKCAMVFRRVRGAAAAAEYQATSRGGKQKAVVLELRPGDVYCLTGESRYDWTHGIRPEDMPGWRVSLTLRKLVPGWGKEHGLVTTE